jgi:DNA-binding response OmpR family regulator
MESGPRDLTPSGIEPIDRLTGGLEKGKLYLTYGEGFAKSLFGMRFLIEGLKLGESAALVTDYSPEDAVRRFARLGYDCLEHIYSGQLIVLECGDDNVKQIAKMTDLTPVLKELRWLMGESVPGRVVFEPVARLIVGERGDLAARTRQFATWSAGIGSTTLLISGLGEEDEDLIRELQPYVTESFHLRTVDQSNRTTGSIGFDKSGYPSVAAIEVDQSRGIFLLDRDEHLTASRTGEDNLAAAQETTSQPAATSITKVDLPAAQEIISQPVPAGVSKEQAQTDPKTTSQTPATELKVAEPTKKQPAATQEIISQPVAPSSSLAAGDLFLGGQTDGPFADLFDELEAQDAGSKTNLSNPPFPEAGAKVPGAASPGRFETPSAPSAEEQPGIPAPHPAASHLRSNSSPELLPRPVLTQMMADELLRPPVEGTAAAADWDTVRPMEADRGGRSTPDEDSSPRRPQYFSQPVAMPRNFNVLIITGDGSSYKRIAKALKDYSLEMADDGVTGLAKLISFHPDLVVLDVDVQLLDGFKILEHIRHNLDVPIVVVSSSYLRASDRVQWTELGADYYLSKPFSITELRHKARQLIARYRGIDEWITGVPSAGHSDRRGLSRPGTQPQAPNGHGLVKTAEAPRRSREVKETGGETRQPAAHTVASSKPVFAPGGAQESAGNENGHYVPYNEFVKRVEERVKRASDDESWFCIVGCRPPLGGAEGASDKEDILFGLVSSLVRQGDIVSVNEASDIVIMLDDADDAGAKAFLSRLRARVGEALNHEPLIWLRQFPIPDHARG